VTADETISNGAHFLIERGEPVEPRDIPQTSVTPASVEPDVAEAVESEPEPVADDIPDDDNDGEEVAAQNGERHQGADRQGEREGGEGQRRRRRRRGRRGGSEGRPEGGERIENGRRPEPVPVRAEAEGGEAQTQQDEARGDGERPFVPGELGPDGLPRKRRRGRRGGRRGRRGRGEGMNEAGPDRPPADARPPREEAPRPFEGGNAFGGTISSDYDEIDTTPTLEPRPAYEAPRRIDVLTENLPDEIDTTPQPIERHGEPTPSPVEQPARAEQPTRSELPAEEDVNRPKRSGWWQRKSFF
jgi:ribonuclease E